MQDMAVAVEGIDVREGEGASCQSKPPGCAAA